MMFAGHIASLAARFRRSGTIASKARSSLDVPKPRVTPMQTGALEEWCR
jgi:hypothetical protein